MRGVGVGRRAALSLPHERFGRAHLTVRRLSLLTGSSPWGKTSCWDEWAQAGGMYAWPASQACSTFVTTSDDITWRCVYYVALIYLWARYKRISILFLWPAVASLCSLLLFVVRSSRSLFLWLICCANIYERKHPKVFLFFFFFYKNVILNSCWHCS